MSLFKLFDENFNKNDLGKDHPCKNHKYIKTKNEYYLLKYAKKQFCDTSHALYYRCMYCGDFKEIDVDRLIKEEKYKYSKDEAIRVRYEFYEKYPNHVARFFYKKYRKKLLEVLSKNSNKNKKPENFFIKVFKLIYKKL